MSPSKKKQQQKKHFHVVSGIPKSLDSIPSLYVSVLHLAFDIKQYLAYILKSFQFLNIIEIFQHYILLPPNCFSNVLFLLHASFA